MQGAQIYYGKPDFFDVTAPVNMTSDVPLYTASEETFFTVVIALVALHLLVLGMLAWDSLEDGTLFLRHYAAGHVSILEAARQIVVRNC